MILGRNLAWWEHGSKRQARWLESLTARVNREVDMGEIMNTQACSSDFSSSNTVLKPPQTLPPTGEQAFKYLSLWGTYLLKLLRSTCWATWYQQPSLTLVPKELSDACACSCEYACAYV